MNIENKYFKRILLIFALYHFITVKAGIHRSDRLNQWHAFIVGGEEVQNISAFPYVLSMRYMDFHICGASIIHLDWALTAAHCFEDHFHIEMINFRGGSLNMFHGGKIIFVEKFILHPDFDSFSYDNDVAVVKSKEEFSGDKMVAVPLVGFNSFLRAGVVGVITGWGLQANGNHPENLQRLNLAVWNQKECREKWYGKITGSMFCAGGESGSDSCMGDSGGAMTVNGIQVGVVSAGSNDCGIAFPGVFVNLTNFNVRAFILETTGV